MNERKKLAGKVALVAGATRGAGRGIATMLGEAGATVYCTGRSSRPAGTRAPRKGGPFELAKRPETIDETAERVTAAGGRGIAVRTDHTDEKQVQRLLARIAKEQKRLDILVNDVWGGDELTEWDKRPWEVSLEKGKTMLERALWTHIVTARHALPLMLKRRGGLLVEITDGDGLDYRHTLFYDLVKTSVIRLAFGLSEELRPKGVTAVVIAPGFLRSEAVLDFFGVNEATWRDAGKKDRHFLHSETPCFVGRGIAALAADPKRLKKTGRLFTSWGLARDYGLTDIDGRRPDWGAHRRREGFGRDQRESHARFLAAFPRP